MRNGSRPARRTQSRRRSISSFLQATISTHILVASIEPSTTPSTTTSWMLKGRYRCASKGKAWRISPGFITGISMMRMMTHWPLTEKLTVRTGIWSFATAVLIAPEASVSCPGSMTTRLWPTTGRGPPPFFEPSATTLTAVEPISRPTVSLASGALIVVRRLKSWLALSRVFLKGSVGAAAVMNASGTAWRRCCQIPNGIAPANNSMNESR